MDKLKPCPFCGGKAGVKVRENDPYIRCASCGSKLFKKPKSEGEKINAECKNADGTFKLCPYRAWSETHPAVFVGQGDATISDFYRCVGDDCAGFYNGICLRLNEQVKRIDEQKGALK